MKKNKKFEPIRYLHKTRIYVPCYQTRTNSFEYSLGDGTPDEQLCASLDPDYVLVLEGIFDATTKDPSLDWHYCATCQKKRGGKVPKGGFMAITVMQGICSMCRKHATLIPNDDYNWPKLGKKAVFD